MSPSVGMSRRTFLKLAGGGIVVFVGLGPLAVFSQDAKLLYPEDFNAYLLIGKNGRVTVFSGKIEMGQGVLTSQAQMVAEELGVELASIDMVLGDTDKCPWDRGTFGSLTTRMFGPALRAAAAKAREVVITLAAKKLGVPNEKIMVKDGIAFVAGEPNRQVSYGELSKGARITQVVDKKAVLRSVSEFSVIGSSPKRLDALEKVTGAAKYAADIRVPGMLYARILRPPMHGATLQQLDTSDAEKQPGITIVNRGDLIAVLHADPEAAGNALMRIKAEWRLPEAKVDPESIFDHIVSQPAPQKQLTERGDLKAARASAARLFDATYHKGYVAHAAIEPHAALAEIKGGKATVWASTQTPFPTRDRIAQVLGLDPKNVRVITPFLGGGFGGKSADGQAVEAARLAQITGAAVQVAWTRSEEFFNDTFDPASVVKIMSGIGQDGKISLWDYSVYAAGERGATSCYDIPNARIMSQRWNFVRFHFCYRTGKSSSVCCWALALTGHKHERICHRIANRHHGICGWRGPARVSSSQSYRCQNAQSPASGGRCLWLEGGCFTKQKGGWTGVQYRRRNLRRDDGRSQGGSDQWKRESNPDCLRTGHGDRRESRRRKDANRRRDYHGSRVYIGRGASFPWRRDS